MAYMIYVINETKKEVIRTKSNGEEAEQLFNYLVRSVGDLLRIEEQEGQFAEDYLSGAKYTEFSEIELTN